MPAKPRKVSSRKTAPKKSGKKLAKKPAPKSALKRGQKITYESIAAKPKKKFAYEKAAKKLKAYGFKVSPKSSSGKKRVKNLWREYAGYINHTAKPRAIRVGTRKTPVLLKDLARYPSLKKKLYNFKFQKLTKTQRKLAAKSGLFSDYQFTPSGIFIEKPANIPGEKFGVKFTKGKVAIKGGERNDVITRLDTENLIDNPQAEVNRAIKAAALKGKKAKAYSLVVKGYRSQHSSQSLKGFTWYLANKLLPEWLEKNEDQDETDFADIFHLRILY